MIYAEGHDLVIGGVSATELVNTYSEPLYVYDAEVIEERCRRLRSLLPEHVRLLYSLKANPNLSIVGFLRNFVDGADVSSLREMYIASHAGFKPESMYFVGPSKSREELSEAVRSRIGCLVVESEDELKLAESIARSEQVLLRAALRINPAFETAGSRLKMGGTARQFGIDEEEIEGVIERARSGEWVSIVGLHAYVGTRILDWHVAVHNTREILAMARRLQDSTHLPLEFVDVGGGFGVPYYPNETEFNLEAYAAEASEVFQTYRAAMPRTTFVIELGRFLTADSGVYITRVRYVKESRGQKYALVSGGMNHHHAASGAGSLVKHSFPVEVLNKMDLPKEQTVFVSGPLCTPADLLARGVMLPEVVPGDLIGILRSGAYGFTASPLAFISHEWPREIMVYKGRHYLIRDIGVVDNILRGQTLIEIDCGAASRMQTVSTTGRAALGVAPGHGCEAGSIRDITERQRAARA